MRENESDDSSKISKRVLLLLLLLLFVSTTRRRPFSSGYMINMVERRACLEKLEIRQNPFRVNDIFNVSCRVGGMRTRDTHRTRVFLDRGHGPLFSSREAAEISEATRHKEDD